MQKQLLPHQIEDAIFLSHKALAGNFSGMGSGKTLTAIEAARIVGGRVIVVGPPISLTMWQQNFKDQAGATVQLLKTGTTKIDPAAGVLILSYEIAAKRFAELRDLGANVLICDESHALKSSTAKRTKALLGRGSLSCGVKHTWLLTGTPSTRWNDDLWTFLVRADPEGLKARCGGVDLDRFRLRYCITQRKVWPGARYPTVTTVGNQRTEELNQWVFSGLAVRRNLAEVWAAMPPLTINRLQVRLERSPVLNELLKAIEGKPVSQIERELAAGEPHLATLRRELGVSKVPAAAAEILDRVEAGSAPILVGCWHTSVIDGLHAALIAKCRVAVIDGRTSAAARDAAQAAFNAGTVDVLIGQIAACGTSLNLQGGSHGIIVEEDWSPAIMAQFYARMHRLGQKAAGVHFDIFSSDTKVDEAIAKISGRKERGHTALLQQAVA